MTNLPPSGPQPSSRDRDELIAVVVAFGAIGAILAWGLTRGTEGFNLFDAPPLLGSAPAGSTDPSSQSGSILGIPAPGVLPFSTVPDEDEDVRSDVRTDAQLRQEEAESLEDRDPNAATRETERADRAGVAIAPVPVPRETTTAASPSPSPASSLFPDVPNDYWAAPFIAALAERDIVTGFQDGTFQPEKALTRAEYAAQIQQILDQEQQNTIAFNDVPPNYWATPAIDTAVRAGFLRGYPGQVFRPEQAIPKYQVLLSLANGLGLTPPASPETAVNTYQDSAQIPTYAVPAIAAATESGLVVNHPDINTLNPNQPVTRAEVAAMLYQAMVARGQVEPIESEYVVNP